MNELVNCINFDKPNFDQWRIAIQMYTVSFINFVTLILKIWIPNSKGGT